MNPEERLATAAVELATATAGDAEVEAAADRHRLALTRVANSALHQHVVVKVPFSRAGLTATRELTSEGIRVNMTLVFSAPQALLAAEAGATYVSCFMGRVDDISVDSTAVLAEIVEALHAGESEAQVLAASLRHPMHVTTAATLGCEVSTIPYKVF